MIEVSMTGYWIIKVIAIIVIFVIIGILIYGEIEKYYKENDIEDDDEDFFIK